ncbi:hypothetical protein HK405_003603, partial [Cladochytrium tenue]
MPPSPAPPDPASPAAPSASMPTYGAYLEPALGAAVAAAPASLAPPRLRSSPVAVTPPPPPQGPPALAAAVRSPTSVSAVSVVSAAPSASSAVATAVAPPSFHSNPVSVYVFLTSHPHDPLVPSLRPDGALILRPPKRMTHPLAAPSSVAAVAAANVPVYPIGGASGLPSGGPGVVVAVNVTLVALKLRVSRARRRRVRRMMTQQRQQQQQQQQQQVPNLQAVPSRQRRSRSLRRGAPDTSSRSRSRSRSAFADAVAGLFGTAPRPPVFGSTSDTTATTSATTSKPGPRSGRRPSVASSVVSKALPLPPKVPRPDLASPNQEISNAHTSAAAAAAAEGNVVAEPVPRPSVGSLESTATSASAEASSLSAASFTTPISADDPDAVFYSLDAGATVALASPSAPLPAPTAVSLHQSLPTSFQSLPRPPPPPLPTFDETDALLASHRPGRRVVFKMVSPQMPRDLLLFTRSPDDFRAFRAFLLRSRARVLSGTPLSPIRPPPPPIVDDAEDADVDDDDVGAGGQGGRPGRVVPAGDGVALLASLRDSDESNRFCAACGRPGPAWLAFEQNTAVAIIVCDDCSGLFRGHPTFTVRSFLFDVSVFTAVSPARTAARKAANAANSAVLARAVATGTVTPLPRSLQSLASAAAAARTTSRARSLSATAATPAAISPAMAPSASTSRTLPVVRPHPLLLATDPGPRTTASGSAIAIAAAAPSRRPQLSPALFRSRTADSAPPAMLSPISQQSQSHPLPAHSQHYQQHPYYTPQLRPAHPLT